MNDVWTGTVWIIAPGLAVTAWHCVAGGGTITLMFGASQCEARVLDHSGPLDVALLSLPSDFQHPAALSLIGRPVDEVHPLMDWIAHGFPGAINDANAGVTLTGQITCLHSSYEQNPAIQMNCSEAANISHFKDAIYGGMSGGPVVVNLAGEKVLGLISCAPPAAGEHVIFATPIDAIVNCFPEHLGSISISSWNTHRCIATIAKKENGESFETNIDASFINTVWTTGLVGAWCNILPDESQEFQSAFSRILLHAPSGLATSLDLNGALGWSAATRALARKWVPRNDFQSDHLSHRYSWRELNHGRIPSGGIQYPNLSSLAEAIHFQCDSWVLKSLRVRMAEFLAAANPENIVHYAIAADIIAAMTALWNDWRIRLESDSILLHHFLALFLTARGDYDTAQASSGAGPETIGPCLFQPLVFTLAICSSLPPAIADLKHPQPGNFGNLALPGHACGIQILDGLLLQTGLVKHRWVTLMVLVPHCPISIALLRADQASFRERQDEPSASFNHDLPREVVISADGSLLAAMRAGRDSLCAELNSRCNELFVAQRMYKEQSDLIL